jgi:hypothetical protein
MVLKNRRRARKSDKCWIGNVGTFGETRWMGRYVKAILNWIDD